MDPQGTSPKEKRTRLDRRALMKSAVLLGVGAVAGAGTTELAMSDSGPTRKLAGPDEAPAEEASSSIVLRPRDPRDNVIRPVYSAVGLSFHADPIQEASLTEWRDRTGALAARVSNLGHVISRHMEINESTEEHVAPEFFFTGKNGRWLVGIDIAAEVPARDFTISKFNPGRPGVVDFVYIGHNGEKAPSCGIGVAPPAYDYALQISAPDAEQTKGALGIRVVEGHGGRPFALINSADGREKYWIDSRYFHHNLKLKAAPGQGGRLLTMANADGTRAWEARFVGSILSLRNASNKLEALRLLEDGTLAVGAALSAIQGNLKVAAGANFTPGRAEISNRLSVGFSARFGRYFDPGAGGIYAEGRVIAEDGLAVGNAVPARRLGRLVRKMQVFDRAGSPLGSVPLYAD